MASLGLALLCLAAVGCRKADERLEPRFLTWAELRAVKNPVLVTPPGEGERSTYPRERLADGTKVRIQAGGLAWLRRDGGATFLVRGPALLTLRARSLSVDEGRVFVDTPPDSSSELTTPSGKLALSAVRASLTVPTDGATKAYVLSGEVRAEKGRARAGEELTLERGGAAHVAAVLGWEDWTGGLATTDRAAAPAPYGVGTVGARSPGNQGAPRFPLSIQRMDVRVSIEGDFALTEVDQSFFNPSSETVEGIYGFRTPERAILQRFGVDRDGVPVWGRVKEKAAAAAQYQANVYQGSTEDPALLEWDAPGAYRARLYPIGPGETRRVIVRYAEWLDRTGEQGRRRLYTYPMAADGSEDSLPHVEELKVSFDLSRAGARDVRVGMAGVRSGDTLVVQAHDFVPRADLALELFDEGVQEQRAYRAAHSVDLAALPPEARSAAAQKAQGEADYVLIPVRPQEVKLPAGGLDLVVVIDASAATEPATLSIARAATTALLSHLGEEDRALVLAGDDGLRPVVPDLSTLAKLDAGARGQVEQALSSVARGGATDLGAMLSEASRLLDPKRRAALVYIGDAAPTVGELSLAALRERLAKLPAPVRIFGLGVGDDARLDLLSGLAQGAFAERIGDGYQAARAALRVLEETERPVWLGTKVDLGPSVERLFPRQASALVSGETLWLVGRLASSKEPERLKTTGPAGQRETALKLERIDDRGDLGRRWAEARLAQMLEDGEGRASLVDLGMKNGIITPVTSFYVPTKNEMSSDEREELQARSEQEKREAVGSLAKRDDSHDRGGFFARKEEAERAEAKVEALSAAVADNKEGGTGTRAKGEEGSMGSPSAGPGAAGAVLAAPVARQMALKDAQEFGMIGVLGGKSNDAPPPAAAAPSPAPTAAVAASAAPAEPAPPATTGEDKPTEDSKAAKKTELERSDEAGLAFNDGLGLTGTGSGGGGRGDGIGLGAIGSQGFGAGHGRLGGSHATSAPQVRMGQTTVAGQLPPEVVQRIVRQNFGRFRLCYENGLRNDPNLQGKISARFVIGRDGAVSNVANAGSQLSDSTVVSCVLASFYGLTFPQPESGIVTVVYPMTFEPGAVSPARANDLNVNINLFIGNLPRKKLGCSAAASAPLAERAGLWRERLSKVAGSPEAVAAVYRGALAACEAPTYRERAQLLTLMLDAMPGVSGKVSLYHTMARDLGAADVLYRGILARIRTPEDMRELHRALGLETVDPGLLAKLIDSTPEAAERSKKLHELAAQFPDDLALALALLDAYEDAPDDGAARDYARQLRERPDADAAVRTAVGELYLRLADRASAAGDKAELVAEGRRAFGEIVEFAPEDPVARRRLGDLLLAHRFFAEAARQYETLARLTPDDAKVLLLRAAAAEGQGLLEEALKWAEKGGASGAPDGSSGPAVTARALAATHLAWARLAAAQAKQAEELEKLSARAERLLAGSRLDPDKPASIRVSLVWSHPELHPSLWTNALGTPMPAPDGDVTLGISQALVPERADSFVEVRLEPADVAHAARLGASAELTVVFDELGKAEKIVRRQITFQRGGPPTQRFALAGKEVHGG
ncbi:MAG TPA: AgmX/PglI C-terminal domain-containing protein [Polyangiaceae bacterium]|nr:AgmX/PglI C-terminal domain-containing protein [Polyangiaceae bacterium]